MFRELIEKKRLPLTIEQDPQLPHALEGDAGKVRQVLINLLSNAVKFTERGRVTVRVSSRAGSAPDRHLVDIAVEDTGPGIESRDLTRIFDAFDQADSGVRSGGTGLGLAISRNFARLMHGDLVVESMPGKGSVFTFSFEAGAALSDAIPEADLRPVPTGLDTDQPAWKLLIVDDVQTNRDLLDELLSRIGFTTASRRAARRPSRSATRGIPIWCSWTCACPVWAGSKRSGACARAGRRPRSSRSPRAAWPRRKRRLVLPAWMRS
jgi:anti-sigma regulatory factor (Ser/Thr protein kinase)